MDAFIVSLEFLGVYDEKWRSRNDDDSTKTDQIGFGPLDSIS